MLKFAFGYKKHQLILKNNKANILYSWVLLICFIAGQYVVYAHQHKIVAGNTTNSKIAAQYGPRTIVQEKCSLCDAMHHMSAVVSHYTYFSPNIVTKHFYKAYSYNFISIALVLAAGRAPPVSASC
ncbi:hypothetical protein [Mucilaginibacter sp. dw_454]|uniref:hypothetical protein n=1 Tax=Mucilaginibacter sp. dw_454 TaxID=2720079 RepID=UPI001BD4DA5F|nr:hypothetical protein [Mucilaginibacter sp. dw_454]